jgi:hypothetical protein
MSKAVIIAALGLSISSLAFAAGQGAPAYQPFPNGYGYMDPSEIDILQTAVKAGDHAAVREHGWRLWAGIMQPAADGNWPIWFTWPNSTAAFLQTSGSMLARSRANATSGGSLLQLRVKATPARSLLKQNRAAMAIPVNVERVPYYPIPSEVRNNYPKAISTCDGEQCIIDGAHFQFNGDILIVTESLSQEGFNWIRDNKYYLKATLDTVHKKGVHELSAPQTHVVTKHMYWPVKADMISAIPVWHDYHDASYAGFAGYETWPDLVAIDPTGKDVGKAVQVNFLYGVFQYNRIPWRRLASSATVYGLNDFYYHKVTAEDWNSFDDADKAILNASSYWSSNKPFGVGDFLVTVAMHVNTKEIPTWALQSVWWSDRPDAAPYAANRPQIPQAKGPWNHYLLVDSYGIPETPGGDQPVAMNPYIELAIHPVGTNCNNCHNRAGWPKGTGKGQSSYQNPDCPNPLETLSPNSACLAALTLTDFLWIIRDRAGPPPPPK